MDRLQISPKFLQYDLSSSSWSWDYLDPSSFLDLWSAASGNNNTGLVTSGI